MKTDLNQEKLLHIRKEYNRVSEKIAMVCGCIQKESWRKKLPGISAYSLEIFKHGVIDCNNWDVMPETEYEESKIWVSAWDGYDAEPYENTSVIFPLEFISMDEKEIFQVLRGEK